MKKVIMLCIAIGAIAVATMGIIRWMKKPMHEYIQVKEE